MVLFEVPTGIAETIGRRASYLLGTVYAPQPYLLELYGDPETYQIAGLVAAIVAGAQIVGGLAAPRIRKLFHRRTSALIATSALGVVALGVVALGLIGVIESFWAVIGLVAVWGLLFAASMPIRQTYLNGLIPSRQRATILSFDSLMDSIGGVWAQPVLGRAADVWGYAGVVPAGRGDLPYRRALPAAIEAAERSRRHDRGSGDGGRRSDGRRRRPRLIAEVSESARAG
ncbi:hypothetical protein BH18ACT17_BH18ACT17_06760 [soil metagenome]